MQNIIRLGFFMVLCVSTSLWAEPGFERSDSEMSGLELSPPAVGIYLGERLSRNKDSGGIKCMGNAIESPCTKEEYERILKEGILVIGDQEFSNFRNTHELVKSLARIMEELKQNTLVFTFDGKKYEIQVSDGEYEILNCYK